MGLAENFNVIALKCRSVTLRLRENNESEAFESIFENGLRLGRKVVT